MTAHGHDTLRPIPNLNAGARGPDRRTLDGIFRHPLSHNLSWREVVNLMTAIGTIDERRNGEFVLAIGDHSVAMKKPHHKDLEGADVMELRRFLTLAGWSPDATVAPPGDAGLPPAGFVVVIDHAGAAVHRITGPAGEGGEAALPPIHHQIDRRQHDADRDETYPADRRFFEAGAAAVGSEGNIVLIGHGTGQSNEAAHLTAYLHEHQKPVFERIVGGLVADLPRLTTRELLELGRAALDVHRS